MKIFYEREKQQKDTYTITLNINYVIAMIRTMLRAILSMAFYCIFVSCHAGAPADMMLFDFESDKELDSIQWKCHTLVSLSDEHATHGIKSLRMEFYPSDYPRLHPHLDLNDWKKFKKLCFDLYNPLTEDVSISVLIDDHTVYTEYPDRYNKDFIIKPGLNRLTIPFNTLITSGTHRALDLKKIYKLMIFMSHPAKKYVLYVDWIRLIS